MCQYSLIQMKVCIFVETVVNLMMLDLNTNLKFLEVAMFLVFQNGFRSMMLFILPSLTWD